MVASGHAARMARMTAAKCAAPPSLRSARIDRGDDDVVQAELGDGLGDTAWLASMSGSGRPVRTLQKAHARVDLAHDHYRRRRFCGVRRCWGSRPPRRRSPGRARVQSGEFRGNLAHPVLSRAASAANS